MPYTITRSDGTKTNSIADNEIDELQFSVGIVGRNSTSYGETIATTQVHIMENFASDSAPGKAVPGQLWYDTANKVLSMNVGTADYQDTWARLASNDGSAIGGDPTATPPGVPVSELWATDINADNFNGGHFVGLSFTGTGTGTNATFEGDSAKFTSCQSVSFKTAAADVAERFSADRAYTYGTVVKIGGTHEVTQTTEAFCDDVFGVVSETPGIKLNNDAGNDETHPFIAFSGRVQVNVAGAVKKGARVVSSATPGVAIAPTKEERATKMTPYNIIGRALETSTDLGISKVWVAVGAK